ncbi:hypothetical protein [Streptomyces cupreus]|uniref:Uncharacterized protein n=1 Tax=Streptomyces cupreus TaxID=2759956 RepID=A0A7X1MAG8_9ACTN|nr:hypothetical protein [Streptomyces cupreus]MBC2904132.1 hypothetical protein [Streptomyces cupreus]
MFGKKTQQSSDLTSPENVKKGQQVYDRIVSGKCKTKDVTAELDATYGRKPKRG